MASVSWDFSGILFIAYLVKGKTINIIEPIETKYHKKTASFFEEKMHIFARQCTSSQIDRNDFKSQ